MEAITAVFAVVIMELLTAATTVGLMAVVMDVLTATPMVALAVVTMVILMAMARAVARTGVVEIAAPARRGRCVRVSASVRPTAPPIAMGKSAVPMGAAVAVGPVPQARSVSVD